MAKPDMSAHKIPVPALKCSFTSFVKPGLRLLLTSIPMMDFNRLTSPLRSAAIAAAMVLITLPVLVHAALLRRLSRRWHSTLGKSCRADKAHKPSGRGVLFVSSQRADVDHHGQRTSVTCRSSSTRGGSTLEQQLPPVPRAGHPVPAILGMLVYAGENDLQEGRTPAGVSQHGYGSNDPR
jgi:hypothetical protein